MKNEHKLLASILILYLICAKVIAGNGSGKVEIEHVGGYGNGSTVFFYTTNHSNKPTCNTHRERWVLDLNSLVGKEQYSLLLSAQMAEKEVIVGGSGDCGLFFNSETASWVGYPVTHP